MAHISEGSKDTDNRVVGKAQILNINGIWVSSPGIWVLGPLGIGMYTIDGPYDCAMK